MIAGADVDSSQSMDEDLAEIMTADSASDEQAAPNAAQAGGEDAAGFAGLNDRRHALEGSVDRREHTRYTVDAWAEVMVKDGTMLFRGRVLDLSLGGCYVETEARLRLAPGTPVEMVFRLGERVFRCEAVSRMMRTHGAGFLFDMEGGRMRRQLEGFLEALSTCDA